MADNNASSSTTGGGNGNGNSSNRNQNRGKDQNSRGRGRGRGGRGQNKGRGGSKEQDARRKKDVGRGEWNRQDIDKRQRNNDQQEARRKKIEEGGEPAFATPFSKDEIEAEARKPKRKVAVMIGYAGSGYKGMQINNQEKTIEGDLFKAFVAAGAISKANADDPKKSSLVRCARTDKGVHAAGNVISLKLIVEDPDIVKTINENLPPQIRVWGIERTNGSFSCYQTCDSRWYEYLIPTYSFIPPHPESFLGKKLVQSAEQEGIYETYQALQADAASFWTDAEEKYVKPILDKLDPELRANVMNTIHSSEEEAEAPKDSAAPKQETTSKVKKETKAEAETSEQKKRKLREDEDDIADEERAFQVLKASEGQEEETTQKKRKLREDEEDLADEERVSKQVKSESSAINNIVAGALPATETIDGTQTTSESTTEGDAGATTTESKSILTPLEQAVKEVKAAYIIAKKAYRISDVRRQRVQEALDCYLGTCNFHNYTIQKTFSDPSAKRVIRSFKVGPDPVIINDTEWLSLKVHGQSFMMHQIRKMVAMVALVVRCGTKTDIIKESYGPPNISIPKAPGLGLLLERPVFDSYNEKAINEYSKEKIDFDKYEKEMNEFKQREIYDRIFREEERDHQFHAFFHHVDHFKTDYFLWVTAGGIAAAKQSKAPARTDNASDDEADPKGEEG